MLLYAILSLLTATILANKCDKVVFGYLFELLDRNNDTNVTWGEAVYLFKLLDADNDTHLTKEEVLKRPKTLGPKLRGNEDKVFEVMDVDRSGDITLRIDIALEFRFIDRNRDGIKSRGEWDSFMDTMCPILFPEFKCQKRCQKREKNPAVGETVDDKYN